MSESRVKRPKSLPLTRRAFETASGSTTAPPQMIWQRGRDGPLKSVLAARPNLSVLVVHDDAETRAVLRRALNALGIAHITVAEDGQAGLDRIRRRGPDLAIVGYEMGAMGGLAFLRQVRRHSSPALRRLPVIVTIAAPTSQQIVEIDGAGAHEILATPVTGGVLARHIAAIFNQNRKHIETATYSGPERRGGGKEYAGKDRRRDEKP